MILPTRYINNFCLALRYEKNLKERKYNEEKKSLLTCLKEEISIKKQNQLKKKLFWRQLN